jgi:HlyD family secretion protein
MLKRYAIVILGFLLLLSACAKKDAEEKYTSVLEGTKGKVNTILGGTITQLNVAEGDSVLIGDVIAVLDSREIGYQGDLLEAYNKEIDAQEALYHIQINQAQTDLAYVRTNMERTQNLYNQGAIPQKNVDDLTNLESKAKSQLEAARKGLDVLAAKRSQLSAQGETLSKKLGDTNILASASGCISTLYYHRGEVLPPLGQLAEIVTLDTLETSIYVSEDRLSQIKIGQTVMLKVGGQAKTLQGNIIRIANQAEFTPKTVLTPDNRASMVYAVRIRVLNHQGSLKDGMPVDVWLK